MLEKEALQPQRVAWRPLVKSRERHQASVPYTARLPHVMSTAPVAAFTAVITKPAVVRPAASSEVIAMPAVATAPDSTTYWVLAKAAESEKLQVPAPVRATLEIP